MKPSRLTLRTLLLIASAIGVIDSGYLTWIKLSHNEASCLKGVGDCASVNTSRYSEVLGLPVAFFGLLAYLAILVLVLLEKRSNTAEANAPLAVFGISLFGVLYSAYLTYLEIAVIHAICPFCVVSAVIMLVIFAISTIRLFGSIRTIPT